jgi:hypothetical protein
MANEARSHGISGVPVTIIDGKWAVKGSQRSDAYIQVGAFVFPIHLPYLNPMLHPDFQEIGRLWKFYDLPGSCGGNSS